MKYITFFGLGIVVHLIAWGNTFYGLASIALIIFWPFFLLYHAVLFVGYYVLPIAVGMLVLLYVVEWITSGRRPKWF